MVQKKTEGTLSESSYEQFNPTTGSIDDVSSVVVSEDEDTQSTRVTSGSRNSGIKSLHPDKERRAKSFPWKMDETFFFSFVTFRVEERLFRVPRDAFENQSQYFRDLFASKAPMADGNVAGDINDPIYLEEIDEDAFRDLLRLLYPPPTSSSFTGPVTLSREQWIKVLDLGQKWDFTGVRAYAIEKLEAIELEEVDKLELALKYEIKQWYNDAYLALCKRPRPLSTAEGRRLGLDLSLKIAEAREQRLARSMEGLSNAAAFTNSLGAPSMPATPGAGSRASFTLSDLDSIARILQASKQPEALEPESSTVDPPSSKEPPDRAGTGPTRPVTRSIRDKVASKTLPTSPSDQHNGIYATNNPTSESFESSSRAPSDEKTKEIRADIQRIMKFTFDAMRTRFDP